ncbi:MAG: Hsp70 family protein [Xenococcaceae cyanobacterium]
MGKVIGIDLGTTNSVAAFRAAKVEVVTADGNTPPDRKLTRSVVADQQGTLCVGESAYYQLRADPENVIVSIKRLMGRGFGELTVEQQLNRFDYKITKSTQGTDNSLSVWLGNNEYQPEDISAKILKQVVQNAQAYLQAAGKGTEAITEVVITVPAYFNDKHRYATSTAAIKAGLTPRELLAEPTAAAISYGFTPDDSDVKTILVSDFGGGTFDASLITAAGSQFIEQGKAGDLWLGGDDIDQLIVQFVKEQVAQEEDLDDVDGLIANMPPKERVRFLGDLKITVEKAKIELSQASSTNIIPATAILDEEKMPILIDVELTRSKFEEMIEPLVERSIEICHDALQYSEYTADLVDVVLLVGGSSQIPLIQSKFREVFGANKVVVHPSPMYAVAEGAAIVAASGLTQKVVTVSRDYFIKLESASIYKIISRGEPLPVTTSHTFKTVADGQRLICFDFFNRDEIRKEDEPIGKMWLGLEQPYPKGTEILVTLELNEQLSDLRSTAVLKNDPSVKVSCTFSRGRSDEKIYNELDQAIEELNQANNLTIFGVELAFKLAVPVVRAANMIVDKKTGEERTDFRERTQMALREFQVSMSDERVFASRFAFDCDFVVEVCGFLLPEPQLERMRSLSQRLKDAIATQNLSAMQALSEDAERELDNLPDQVQLLKISMIAIKRAKTIAPTEANAMADKLVRILEALKREDGNEAERLWCELEPDVRYWLEQQLPTGSIVTGLNQ